MLSRRDKLLIQPWEDRRFKDHRSKVRSALPAIDDRAPAARPHVALKLKKNQRELDRKNKIQSENFSLLQRLNDIMKVNRLDNHWRKPLPNFQQKVGLFYDAESLQSKVTARSLPEPSEESYTNVKCYACEMRKVCLSRFYVLVYNKEHFHHCILLFIYRNSMTTCISRSIETPCLLFIQTNINIVTCFLQ
ncbi:uncharacterized protein LOC111352450 isoform X1 [Spodoptera litura]|uniref:Uncharacterized protein LOC111352450 isoform X1 n=1 Tax=Spodoptera litura TaxID=69820 RepID=A0A9J7E2N6_SPOLT|nr:uncharacterized protein LOC111352450 isoform X1 [Spodoptera litura]